MKSAFPSQHRLGFVALLPGVLGVMLGCTTVVTDPADSSQTTSGAADPGAGGDTSSGGAQIPGGGSASLGGDGNLGVGATGATSTMGGSGTTPGGANGSGGSTIGVAQPPIGVPAPRACTGNSPGPRKLRRLTASQYEATLRDLFKDPSVPKVTIFDDSQVLGFTADADALVVQGLTGQQLFDYAEQVANWAVKNKLSTLSSCTSADSNCRQSFIKSFGKRAFREPLTEEQVSAYEALMTEEESFSDGAEAVLTAMLQSPNLLYRRELGPVNASGNTVNLTPYEVASSLSYLLIGSMPDEQLFAAADNGQLSNKDQLDQQFTRLLQDPKSQDALMGFFNGWLTLGRFDTTVKDDTVLKLTDSLRSSMKGETRSFILELFKSGGTVADLFSANYTFLNQELAQFYGINAAGLSNDQFSKVMLDASSRRDVGVLAHADVLTGNADSAISSPVFRGKLVRTRLLCGMILPPPANLDTKLKPSQKTETTREHFAAHSQDPNCAGCHRLMDPIGFGFEHYDAFGRWRDQENGIDIDTSGVIYGTAQGDVPFDGLSELGTFLANSEDVKACAVRFWAYYAYGSASWNEDACTYSAIQSEAASGGTKLRDILAAIVHAPHFTQRLAQ